MLLPPCRTLRADLLPEARLRELLPADTQGFVQLLERRVVPDSFERLLAQDFPLNQECSA